MLVKRFFLLSADQPLGRWNVHFGLPERGFGAKSHFMWKTATLDKMASGFWFQPLQITLISATPIEKRKRNAHSLGLLKGVNGAKKSFRSFQKTQFEKRIFNQYYEYHKFVENQLNFKPILETKSAPFRTVRINRTTILGNQSTWDKSRVMHHRHFNRLFSAKKG